MIIKTTGKIEVNNGVRIILHDDFVRYYQWLINKYHYNTVKTQLPKHRAHITVVNPKIHKNVDFNKAKKYIGKVVDVTFDPEEMYISKVNYWIPVKCEFADKLKKELGVNDGANYYGLHATICNKKFND